MTMIGLDAR